MKCLRDRRIAWHCRIGYKWMRPGPFEKRPKIFRVRAMRNAYRKHRPFRSRLVLEFTPWAWRRLMADIRKLDRPTVNR